MIRSVAVLFALVISFKTHAASDLASLYQTKTLVGIRTVSYTIRHTDGSTEERSSELFRRFEVNEDCINDDNRDLYSEFQLMTITEQPQNDEPQLNKWVEGVKIDGTVIKKETQLCFALQTSLSGT